jgi:hypothetical protein
VALTIFGSLFEFYCQVGEFDDENEAGWSHSFITTKSMFNLTRRGLPVAVCAAPEYISTIFNGLWR